MSTVTSPRGKLESPETARLLYRFEAQLEFNAIGLVPEGIRMANRFEGKVTAGELADGPFAGARVWGVDHFLLRSDGVGVIDAGKTISVEGRHIHEHVQGYTVPPAGMEPPPAAEILAPGFEWPDALFSIHGFSQFRAGLPELAYLNRALAVIEGWASFATGGLAIETRIVAPTGAVAGPAPTANK